MSRTGHARRMKSLERADGPGGWLADYHAAIRDLNREEEAAVTLVRVAQALAGTVMQPRWVDGGSHDSARETAPCRAGRH